MMNQKYVTLLGLPLIGLFLDTVSILVKGHFEPVAFGIASLVSLIVFGLMKLERLRDK